MSLTPYVIEDIGRGERSMDIYSRLLKDRIIFIGTDIYDQMADAFGKAERYQTQDGQEYVAMIIRLETIYQLIEGQKDVTNITQILNS